MTREQRHREAKREYWRRTLADWACSGMSKSDYARRHGLEASRLRWWSSHYPHWARRGQAPASETADAGTRDAETARVSSQRFVTLQPQGQGGEADPAAPTADSGVDPLRLIVGGTTVEVPPGFCEQTLERLLGVLERRA